MASEPLTATATMSSGDTADVTALATWTSSDNEVATVSTSGVVTAVAVGTATVTASYQGLTSACAVTVTDPVEGLAVSPATATVDLG